MPAVMPGTMRKGTFAMIKSGTARKAASGRRALHPRWGRSKNYELVFVVVASVLGFAIVIFVITMLELSSPALK